MVVAALFCIATGCSTPRVADTPETVGGIELASRKSNEQLIVFITPDDEEFVCLAPTPDAYVSFDESISISSSLSESADHNSGSLGGRTGLVLLSREIFYRVCEFSRNYKLSKDEALSVYMKQLDLIRDLGSDLAIELDAGDS